MFFRNMRTSSGMKGIQSKQTSLIYFTFGLTLLPHFCDLALTMGNKVTTFSEDQLEEYQARKRRLHLFIYSSAYQIDSEISTELGTF